MKRGYAVRERAEMALLGMLLLADTKQQPERLQVPLEPEHFFWPQHATIYRAISEVAPVTPLGSLRLLFAVKRQLVETLAVEELTYVGGLGYLGELFVAGAGCKAAVDDLVKLISRCPRCHK